MSKPALGQVFKAFRLGQRLRRASPRPLEARAPETAERVVSELSGASRPAFDRGRYDFGRARSRRFADYDGGEKVDPFVSGRPVAPGIAGDTGFAGDVAALRLRIVATQSRPCADFPARTGKIYDPKAAPDFDFWLSVPR